MASSEIILYDLASKGRCACWSHNPWKIRLFLNYKEIPYKTLWIEYPDIAPTFKSLGIPPNPTGVPYTIPTIRFSDSTYLQDSHSIASTLETLHPTPSLKLTSPRLSQAEDLITKLQLHLRPLFLPPIPLNLLNDASRGYFEETRKERIGMPLSEYSEKKGGEECWKAAEPVIESLGELLKSAGGGPFIEGDTPSYADFFIVATLQMFKRVDEKIFARLVETEEALGKVYEACKPWLKRDDY